MKNNSTLLKFIYFAIKREGSRITSTPVQQEYEFYDFFLTFPLNNLAWGLSSGNGKSDERSKFMRGRSKPFPIYHSEFSNFFWQLILD